MIHNTRHVTLFIPRIFIARHQSTIELADTAAFQDAKPFADIPSPKGVPILKNLPTMVKKENLKNGYKVHAQLREQLGNIYRLRMPGKNKDIICITDPSDVRTLLSHDGPIPFPPGFEKLAHMRTTSLKHLFKIPGLLSQGEVWSNARKAVQQDMMRPKSAMYYVAEMNDIVEELCDKLGNTVDASGDLVNLNHTLQQFALEATGIMFIGSRLGVMKGAEDGEKLMQAVGGFISRLGLLFALPLWALKISTLYSEIVRNQEIMYTICNIKVQEAIANHEKDGSLEGTILGKLLARCGKDSQLPVVMAVDSMSAGIDTTAHTATFLLYHLATNPDKQEILYKEICDVIGREGKMTEAKLADMKYLKACQQESQRIWPIALGSARMTQRDLVLCGYHIPKGTNVLRVGLASTDSRYYSEPERFLPERWLRECPAHKKVDSYANLPFGHGPRSCIGQRFARLELYMVAFKVVQRYRLEYHHDPIEIDYTGVGHPDRDVRIRLIPRT